MFHLELKNIAKEFGNIKVLEDINLDIESGEFIVLLGPSGSGKSTILRIIAGLEEPTRGEVLISGKVVNKTPPKDRDIAMVFQNYALYPHLNIYENLAFSLKMKGFEKEKLTLAVNEIADLLGVKNHLLKKPKELSGGEKQRVALGRAIIRKPQMFLMDEPLSNLDAKLRIQMRLELLKLHKKISKTFIYVTHDQIEALTMGNRIVVLNEGKIQQIGSPQNIYHEPINTFVANFVGTPPINLFNFKVLSGNKVILLNKQFELKTENKKLKSACEKGLQNNDLILGLRPENLSFNNSSDISVNVVVDLIELLGNECLVYLSPTNLDINNKINISVKLFKECNFKQNDKLTLSISLDKALYFDKKTTSRIVL